MQRRSVGRSTAWLSGSRSEANHHDLAPLVQSSPCVSMSVVGVALPVLSSYVETTSGFWRGRSVGMHNLDLVIDLIELLLVDTAEAGELSPLAQRLDGAPVSAVPVRSVRTGQRPTGPTAASRAARPKGRASPGPHGMRTGCRTLASADTPRCARHGLRLSRTSTIWFCRLTSNSPVASIRSLSFR